MKKIGTKTAYPRPTDKANYEFSVLIFSDACSVDENGQIGVIAGLLVGERGNNTFCNALSWVSHKSKYLVKSVTAAEIIAATERIDEVKMIAQAYSEILPLKILSCVLCRL